jgi:arabinofuranosyltransferase
VPGPGAVTGSARAALLAALAITLVVLLFHAWSYSFLTDDAFISFRYARNLSHGQGLVFNPGGERVEGYSNMLWVLLLSGLDRVGVPPERAAAPLGMVLTALLWAVVAGFAWRDRPKQGAWLVLVPPLLLALTRSVAVWSTSGLETRFFEVLIVAGVLRQVVEIESALADRRRVALAPWLFALASLARPDGILIAGCVFATAAAVLLRRPRGTGLVRFARGWLPCLALVGAHFAFRLWYYHSWVPNTYYAKVGGQMWWGAGARYLAAFALEYGACLWVPLLVLAVLHHRARGTAYVPLLYAAAVLPHLAYVMAIGGDHFEYRPLDVYFPILFLLLYDGARRAIRRPARTPLVAAYLGLVIAGLVLIPWESHRQFPNRYITGFPGLALAQEASAAGFLDPDRDAVLRLPGPRQVAMLHRRLLASLTAQFVCVRQEEHRLFLETAIDDGMRLRDLVRRGVLPRDLRVAIDCVGAIPYISDLWTLDRLGLTDAHVAHSGFLRKMMAHGKSATLDYGRERGVDLWAVDPVHCLTPYSSVRLIASVMAARDSLVLGRADTTWTLGRTYAADGRDGYLFFCALPAGIERARRRMPGLEFRPLADPVFIRDFVLRSLAACRDSLRVDPDNHGMKYRVGYLERVAASSTPPAASPGSRP